MIPLVLIGPERREPTVRLPDFQVVYGRLRLEGQRHELVWSLDRVFRPLDLLFWGHEKETMLESFCVGTNEQLVGSFPPALALRNPMYPIEGLLDELEDPVPGDHLIGAKLKRRIYRCNPSLDFDTGNLGNGLRLVLSGPLRHAVVLGVSI